MPRPYYEGAEDIYPAKGRRHLQSYGIYTAKGRWRQSETCDGLNVRQKQVMLSGNIHGEMHQCGEAAVLATYSAFPAVS